MSTRSMVSVPQVSPARRFHQPVRQQNGWGGHFRLLPLVLLSLGLILAPCVSAQTINRIFFFGDSLSDGGNHFIATHESTKQPFPLDPPVASYDIGGHHFSDGATWAEQLATALHTPTSGSPSLRAPGLFTNYAIGRARARAGAPDFPQFDLNSQIKQYLSDFAGRPAQPTDLFVIWIGANDVDDALNALAVDPSGATSVGIIQSAIAAIIGNPQAGAPGIQGLYAAGARMFLVANVPDFANTPYVQFLGQNVDPSIPAISSLFTGFFDTGLDHALTALAAGLPPLPNQFVREFDVNALFNRLLKSPADFGLTDVTGRCTTPGVIGHALCSQPHSYLFWDGTHPTTAAHTVIAESAIGLLPRQ